MRSVNQNVMSITSSKGSCAVFKTDIFILKHLDYLRERSQRGHFTNKKMVNAALQMLNCLICLEGTVVWGLAQWVQ